MTYRCRFNVICMSGQALVYIVVHVSVLVACIKARNIPILTYTHSQLGEEVW